MANTKHLARLKEDVEAWNAWRKKNHLITPDLTGADLSGAALAEADLTGASLMGAFLMGADLLEANLTKTNLIGAHLIEADLIITNLAGANLSRTNLTGANLFLTNLQGANLTGANLSLTNFSGTLLRRANFRSATLSFTVFADVDLSKAMNLNHCTHKAPSTLGVDTIYRSNGKIPDTFLRGCGVPETFITYAKSLVGSPVEFYSCFISHSTKDQEFADRLNADLQAKGVRCWFAPHNIQGGKKIHEQIDEAIRGHDKLLLVLSSNSMQSEWVKTEIGKARERETRERKRMLFPLRLVEFDTLREWECFDGDTGKDSAREIREYFIPDFSEWKTNHHAYRVAFDRLMHDLKAGEGSGTIAR